MRLTLGITQMLPEWEIVIQQIGIPYEIISFRESISSDQFSVIIVTQKGAKPEKDVLQHYLNSGGSILIEADVAEWLFNIRTVPAFVNTIEPTDDPIFSGVLPGFIQTRLSLPRRGDVLESVSGRKLVQIHTSGKGTALILPGGLSSTVLDTKARRRNFPTYASHLPSERVARRSKNTIREVIQRSLEYLHFVRHLPFLSLYPFPDEHQSIFNFRIDTDFASEEEIDSFYQLCINYDVSATWFVETKSAKDSMEQFAQMKNQEIGLHCYHHKVSNSYSFNRSNIKEGCRILNEVKIPFCGYAAPYGEWNIPLAKAIERAGFIYSSEFTLDYDNLPFYPYLRDRFSSVLQVPIHPVSPRRLRNARHTEDDMKNYFKDVIRERIEHNLPVFIYDHPSSGNLNILNWLLQYIHQKDISTHSLKDYANWWKRRLEVKWTPKFNKGRIDIQWQHSASPIYLLVKKSPQDSAVIKSEKVIDLHELKWQKKKLSSKLITPMALRIKLNRKMIFNDILSFYGRLKQ